MRICVISLPDEQLRRERAAAQLSRAQLDFEFADATRGEDVVRDGHFDRFDQYGFLMNTGRVASTGELGCFASHRTLWRRSIASDEPLLILEDDFHLHEDFPEALRHTRRLIREYGFIRLQVEARSSRTPVSECGNFILSRYRKAPYGTAGYAISPDVARTFVAVSDCFSAPVDLFVKNFWDHGHTLYALTPYTVSLSEISQQSRIGGRKKIGGWRVSSLRMQTKAGWYVNRWRFNVAQLLRESPGWRSESGTLMPGMSGPDD